LKRDGAANDPERGFELLPSRQSEVTFVVMKVR